MGMLHMYYLLLPYSYSNLVIGSDSLTPEGSTDQRDRVDYKFVWITTGYQPTKKSVCREHMIYHLIDLLHWMFLL